MRFPHQAVWRSPQHSLDNPARNMVGAFVSSRMATAEILNFAQACDAKIELKHQISQAKSPSQIIAIANQAGFDINLADLGSHAGDLSAHYWPWSGKGFLFRRAFFQS